MKFILPYDHYEKFAKKSKIAIKKNQNTVQYWWYGMK